MRFAVLALSVATLSACGPPPPPLGAWRPREEKVSRGRQSCAPAESIGNDCAAVPAPGPNDAGPRYLIGDTIGLGPITVADRSLYFTKSGPDGAHNVTRVGLDDGKMMSFASTLPHSLLDLAVDGEWLVGHVLGFEDGNTIARIHRERGKVDYMQIGERPEWLVTFSVDGAGGYCVLVGRPGPGHAEHALVRVPRGGGPRMTLVPFGEVEPRGVACDREHAYFDGKSGLARVSLGGGTPVVLGTSASRVALGSNDVYAATTRGIERLAKGWTQISLLAPVEHSGTGRDPVQKLIAVEGGVVWSERNFPDGRRDRYVTRIRRCIGGEQCETLDDGPGEITLVAAHDGVVYWTKRTRTRYGDTTAIFAARKPATLTVPQ